MTVDFSNLAQQSTTATDFEASVLEVLGQRVGFDAAFFLTKGLESSSTIVGLDGRTAAHLTANGEAYATELLPVMHAALAARGVAVDTDVCGAQYVRKSRYYREIATTIGGQHSLLAYVPWGQRIVATMMLGRIGKSFSTKEIQLVASLLPNLGVARAAFGLPSWNPAPLPLPKAAGLFERLRRARGSRLLASVQTERGTIVVRDRAGFREMVATDGTTDLVWTRASLQDPRRSGWPYSDLFHLAPALALHKRRALFIGSGGAVSVHQFASAYPGMHIDLVEHEPVVVELARDWFGLDTIPGVTVHVADGISFVEDAMPAPWDVVVIDAYDAVRCSVDLCRHSFLTAVHRSLRRGGTVACNVIGTLGEGGSVSEFTSAARRVFDTVRMVPVLAPEEAYSRDALRNVVVIAGRFD